MADTNVMGGSQAAQPAAPEKAFGPVAAAFLASGIGAVVLGILTTLAEASSGTADALQFSARVGPLSGKTLLAVAAFIVSWVVLHLALREKDPEPRKVFTWVAVMFGVAVILTFPTFFQAFAPSE